MTIRRLNLLYLVVVCLQFNFICGRISFEKFFQLSPTKGPEIWTGKWFPEKPTVSPSISKKNELYDSKHGIVMGVPSDYCDNGMVNLTVDWDYSPIDYTCFDSKENYRPRYLNPILQCDHIPIRYSASHACMDKPIFYNDPLPTFGTHRPLWPRYGEYRYVPPQRWVHNLEHGAIVMLYHPCTHHREVQLLKSVLKGCLYRHIISPSNLLSPDRPLALLSWGCRLTMSKVDPTIAATFIKTHALNGPEQISKDGQFSQELLVAAQIVSTRTDANLCPQHK